ncbi:hypothetical protein OsI_21783 [Oryza sativa Indica Group]|uniref:non-specific serine/threonine protein kinase n=1 Tax=Oryza sativa subsp. indica TaxID=39946 RepID=B8B370_ORYSI|nr:hypothetical protein OsI_21783 [Oryza sativa Indica Group]
MSGSVPSAIGNLTELNYMNLESNSFSGRIPSTLGNLGMLELLVLSSNNFTGQVPVELFNSTAVSVDLSYNNLEGSIPQEISNLKGLIEFYAQWNKLSGEIPSTIGECQLLQNLHLQNNILNGTIPSSLGQLQGLENLDLSNNNLSGEIPKLLGNLSMLYYLNLSFNNFVGQVPTFGVFANATAISIQGNDMLCGGTPHMHLPPCSSQLPKNKHTLVVIPIVLSLVATVVALALIYIMLRIRCKKSRTETSSTTSMQGHPLISYSQLVKATDGFSSTNLLGSGAFGSVYKGELDGQSSESANLVAVKVLKLQNPGALKSFTAECEALRNLRHRNLVKIVTACSSIDTRGNDFRAIVFEFMPNGSLEGWLHPDANEETEQRNLNILERVTILLDVAYALDYLHCHGPAPVVHCDIKSSNVLLDADMVAHVGDFGLARILVEGNSFLQESSSSIGFRGTIGYAAPADGERLLHKVDLKFEKGKLIHDIGVTAQFIQNDMGGISRIGVMPRFGDADSIIWFDVENHCSYHLFNCFEDGNEVVIRGCRTLDSVLSSASHDDDKSKCSGRAFLQPDKNSEGFDPSVDGTLFSRPYEWRLNLKSGTTKEGYLTDEKVAMDFPVINEDFVGVKNNYGYAQVVDSVATSEIGLFKYNRIAKVHFDRQDKENKQLKSVEYHVLKEKTFCSGVQFVAKENGIDEDDGWIITYVHDELTNVSQVYIIDAKRFAEEPVLKITLPQRVPYGFHGNFFYK